MSHEGFQSCIEGCNKCAVAPLRPAVRGLACRRLIARVRLTSSGNLFPVRIPPLGARDRQDAQADAP